MKNNCDIYLRDLENKVSEIRINSTETKYYILKDSQKTSLTHQIIYKNLEIIKINSLSDSFVENINEKLENCFIIRYMKKGKLNVKNDDGEILSLKAGEVLVSYSKEKETAFAEKQTEIEELIIIVNINYLETFTDDQEIQGFINYFSENRRNKSVIDNVEERLLYIFDLINRYDSKWERKLYFFGKVNELLGTIVRQFTKRILKFDFYEESKVELVRSYIEKNYANPQVLSDIHKKFYLSRTELSRQFKTETGMGLHEYLKSIKLERAFYMLLNGACDKKSVNKKIFL
ncbi:AraC family transcriptional regulator [Sebaldella sp. S0638]|uniref:helix-turn-helix domain-containing protein n=1 Tax=Sebaldella sp. S0638 TaxID=2957809 RepID=UPI0020A0E386|nr:helix-turn-helix domain-containing protein [Sebaldella sp. S0638]MCP1225982.1 AraC family transcriptional regulator [Sebaldella sp. S0638]